VAPPTTDEIAKVFEASDGINKSITFVAVKATI